MRLDQLSLFTPAGTCMKHLFPLDCAAWLMRVIIKYNGRYSHPLSFITQCLLLFYGNEKESNWKEKDNQRSEAIYHKLYLKCVQRTIYYIIYYLKHVQNCKSKYVRLAVSSRGVQPVTTYCLRIKTCYSSMKTLFDTSVFFITVLSQCVASYRLQVSPCHSS